MSNPFRTQPTALFIGVTTGQSSALKMWPDWMEILGRPDVVLEGVDLPLHADPARYRAVVAQIKNDPQLLGALVTTHKLDLLDAAREFFDDLDPHARQCAEVSSISKRDGRLWGHATDPMAGGRALDAMLGPGYFQRTGGHVFILGGGGAASALSLVLAQAPPADRPQRIVLTDIAPTRLEKLQHLLDGVASDVHFEYILNGDPSVNDRIMTALPDGSLVINATGMGKDRPGSPVTDRGLFPRQGVVWELNYRGELGFLAQARRQTDRRALTVHDGWLYFLHGWSCVVEQILDVTIDGPVLAQLSAVAAAVRG